MKYKVIASICDGWVVANRNNIKAVKTLADEHGCIIDPIIGDIISDKTFEDSDIHWDYNRKEWRKMNIAFESIQLNRKKGKI